MRSLVKAGGGEERNVTRHRVRSTVEAERPHAADLGLDRRAIRRWARHAGHAALRPGLALRFGETSFATMR